MGQKLKIEGVLEIEELLIKGKTVMMYTVLTETTSSKVQSEARKYKWVNKKDVEKMKVEDFTEYFNKELLLNFLKGKLKPIPLKTIKTWEYYKIKNEPGYKSWFGSRKKRSS